MKNKNILLVILIIIFFGVIFFNLISPQRIFIFSPKITGIEPPRGRAGDTVTIIGRNFGDKKGEVRFNGAFAENIESWSNKKIICKVPFESESGDVIVAQENRNSKGFKFTVFYDPPHILNLSASVASPGSLITIYGENFRIKQKPIEVQLNRVPAEITNKWYDKTGSEATGRRIENITCKVPAGAVTGELIVFVNGNASNPVKFTVAKYKWKMQNNLPEGNDLEFIWGSSGNNVFAVGGKFKYIEGKPTEEKGVILHYDGSKWSVNYYAPNYLNGIWGITGSSIFAVGNKGLALYYNGKNWSPMRTGIGNNLNGVWGNAVNNVFAVGDKGTILYYDGLKWSLMKSGIKGDLYGVWGTSEKDVYAVGEIDELEIGILHYDGLTWDVTKLVTTVTPLRGIWGTGYNDIFVVGSYQQIFHYNGKVWEKSEHNFGTLRSVWGDSGKDVYAVGYDSVSVYDGHGGLINRGETAQNLVHYDGESWSRVDLKVNNPIKAVWGSGPEDIFIVGDNGTILHYGKN